MRRLTRGEVEDLANGMISRIIEQDEDVIGDALADSGDWADVELPAIYDWLENATADMLIERPEPC